MPDNRRPIHRNPDVFHEYRGDTNPLFKGINTAKRPVKVTTKPYIHPLAKKTLPKNVKY